MINSPEYYYKSFLAFVEGVAKIEPFRPINHNLTWDECAVGEFADFLDDEFAGADEIAQYIFECDPDLHTILNAACHDLRDIDTYAGLQAMLEGEYEPTVLEYDLYH